jgi:hypothetical protein
LGAPPFAGGGDLGARELEAAGDRVGMAQQDLSWPDPLSSVRPV